jgi:heat shock protein HslJ
VRRSIIVPAVVIVVAAVLVVGFLVVRNGTGGASTLTGKTWYLVSGADANPTWQWVVPADQQANFTIQFNDDKTFSAKADCNQLSGTWSTSGQDGLSIVPGPMTMAYCGDQGFDVLYAGLIGKAKSYATTGTGLDITLTDGGRLSYTSVTPTATPVPSASPTETASPSPSASASASPSPSPSPSPTPSPSPSPSPTPAPATATPQPSGSANPSPTPTAAPTAAPSPTATPAPTASPTAAPSPTPPPAAGLTSNPWMASAVTLIDPPFQGSIPPDQQGKYTITFGRDGSFSAKADCNTVTGTYTTANPSAASGDLTLAIGPTTIALCPEGSYSDLYIAALQRVKSFAIANSALTLTLSDNGSIQYAPVPK